MIVRDQFQPSTSTRIYKSLGKDLPDSRYDSQGKQYAYWMLAERVEEILGSEGGTRSDIYDSVTGPLGLSQSDTIKLIVEAKKNGYLS